MPHDLYLFSPLPMEVRKIAARHRDVPGLVRAAVRDDRLHMTVGTFGRFAETPHAGIVWVKNRLVNIPLPFFRMYVDTLVRGRTSALLQPSEPPPGFRTLQLMLARRLGLDPACWRAIQPHVTLGYGGPSAPTRGIDPMGWTVDRLLLVESLVGSSRHVVHAEWPLAMETRRAA